MLRDVYNRLVELTSDPNKYYLMSVQDQGLVGSFGDEGFMMNIKGGSLKKL